VARRATALPRVVIDLPDDIPITSAEMETIEIYLGTILGRLLIDP
jgi:hypothetical protein